MHWHYGAAAVAHARSRELVSRSCGLLRELASSLLLVIVSIQSFIVIRYCRILTGHWLAVSFKRVLSRGGEKY